MRYGDTFTDGQVTKEAILRLVLERRRSAEQELQRYFAATKMWYSIFRGIGPGMLTGRNNLAIPALFSQIMADVTNKTQAIFQDNEIVQFIPNNDWETGLARKNSNLVNIQLAEADSYLKAVDFFMSASVYGTGFARLSWKYEVRQKMYRVNVMGQEQILPSTKVAFDGPNWEVVDILDLLPEPGKKRLSDCSWVIHTYYVDLDDLLEMQSGEGLPMFSPEAVEELLDSPMGADARDAWKMRTNTYRTWTDYSNRSALLMSKPIRIDEYWGKVPSEFGINGDRNLVITVANERVVLRYEANPYWEDRLPFLCYTPMPDMHSLHGTGKAEIAAPLQAAMNKLGTIKLDSLEIFANPMLVVSDQSDLAQQGSVVARPGKILTARGEDMGKAIMPISPDLRALQLTYEEIAQLSNFQQQGIGIPNDVVQGIDPVARETARSAMMRRDGALGRLAGESTLAEHQFIIPLAQKFKADSEQFLSFPKQIKMIGQDAIMDPISGMPLIGGDDTVNYGDLSYEQKCRALGSSRLISKSQMAQQLMAYGQMAGANPVMAAVTNWVNFTKLIAKAMNLAPTELLIPDVQLPQINQMALMGMVGGGGAEGSGGMQGMGQLTGTSMQNEEMTPNMGGTSDSL